MPGRIYAVQRERLHRSLSQLADPSPECVVGVSFPRVRRGDTPDDAHGDLFVSGPVFEGASASKEFPRTAILIAKILLRLYMGHC